MALRDIFLKRKLKEIGEDVVNNTQFTDWEMYIHCATPKDVIWVKGKLTNLSSKLESDKVPILVIDEFGNALMRYLEEDSGDSPYYKFFFQTEKLHTHKPTGFLVFISEEAENFHFEENKDMIIFPDYAKNKLKK